MDRGSGTLWCFGCSFGPQPDWAVFSESFPVGCLFHPNITCSQFFSVNPDRRRRLYNTATGMYASFCGLSAVHMSWTAYEYLYQVLSLNKTLLPACAKVSTCCSATRPDFATAFESTLQRLLHVMQCIWCNACGVAPVARPVFQVFCALNMPLSCGALHVRLTV